LNDMTIVDAKRWVVSANRALQRLLSRAEEDRRPVDQRRLLTRRGDLSAVDGATGVPDDLLDGSQRSPRPREGAQRAAQ
jgi:hypothetical protein